MMKQYTVGMATYYNGDWHIDHSTEIELTTVVNAIAEGRKLAALGAFPLYTEFVDGERGRKMLEYDGHLEYAFVAI